MRSFASRVFRYAIATARADTDPAHALRGALTSPVVKHYAAITDAGRLAELLRAIDGYSGEPATMIGLKLTPHVFQRPGEVRQMRWVELDFEKATWTIPSSRMKQRKQDHVLPLSEQSLQLLKAMRGLSSHSEFVFPSVRSKDRPMTENTINGALRRLGQRDSYALHTDMTGGGPFRLQAGQWTDDTAMALALADSLCPRLEFDPEDLMRRFVDWRNTGEYFCTGTCFDIGMTTSAALSRWQRTGDPYAGATEQNTAGNGSLMRLAPVAIRFWRDRDALRRIAALQSRTTHGATDAVSACVAYAELLADAIADSPRDRVLAPREGDYSCSIGAIMAGSWRGKARHEIASSGYVAHSLEAALWSVGRTNDFRSAILLAVNLGGDADTTSAIAGQLAGAIYGASGIPEDWLKRLAWRRRIAGMAVTLLRQSGSNLPS